MIVGFGYFVSEIGPFDCFLLVHNHSCMVNHDVFILFYRIMDLVRLMCRAQEWVFLLSKIESDAPTVMEVGI